jgi:hypothetical protein
MMMSSSSYGGPPLLAAHGTPADIAAQVPEVGGARLGTSRYRPRMPTSREPFTNAIVEWPTDAQTGEVFDNTWLGAGTTGALTDSEILRAWRAATKFQSNTEPATKSEVAEYHRAKTALWRHGILAGGGPDAAALSLRLVRGRAVSEWTEHVNHLKRLDKLELALSLVNECIDATGRGDPHGGVTRCGSLTRRQQLFSGSSVTTMRRSDWSRTQLLTLQATET